MASEWRTTTLGELGDLKNGANFNSKDYGNDHPVVSVKSLFRGRFAVTEGLDAIRSGVLKKVDNFLLQKNDILFARSSLKRSGSGQSAIVNELPEGTIFSGFTIRFRVDPSARADPLFLFYNFQSPQSREQFVRIATGTTISNLSQANLSSVLIELPPLSEQKAIAHILGTLDDKIELNRQMNATLEAMAQALFKSWFVDFDPVIDNALAAGNPIPEPLQARAEARKALGDQRKPLPEAIQKQFPDRFVFNDDMGWVPEGWETKPVYEVAKFINGAAFKGSHFSADGAGLPIVKIAEVKNGITGQTKFTAETFDPKFRIDDEEILFSWSGNPDTSIDTFVWSNGLGWLNQHVFKVSLHSDVDREFVYYLLRHLKPVFTEIARDKQTTGLGHVTAGDMKKLLVISPPSDVLNFFSQQSAPIFDRWYENLISNRQLVKLRDTLLPKLLSGQLRIPEAEQQLAASL